MFLVPAEPLMLAALSDMSSNKNYWALLKQWNSFNLLDIKNRCLLEIKRQQSMPLQMAPQGAPERQVKEKLSPEEQRDG